MEGEEGTGGVGPREGSGEEGRDDVACYNHEFFHAGMAKAAPSKTDPLKLKVGYITLLPLLLYSFWSAIILLFNWKEF